MMIKKAGKENSTRKKNVIKLNKLKMVIRI
jgi:hypothetical protein